MMWDWAPGYGWGMTFAGIVMMLVFWGAIVAFLVLLLRYLTASRDGWHDDAMSTLRRRLAAGEITSEEYERLRKALQG